MLDVKPSMPATIEWREEECEECGWTRDRRWLVATTGKTGPIPRGWRVEAARGDWRRIAGPTRTVTLCGCDVP